jgi:DNA processing protein
MNSDKSEQFMDENGISKLSPNDETYPERIILVRKNLPELYHLGPLTNYNNGISVVGTRSCSKFGEEFARNLGNELSAHGYKVISGLAKGIDTFAHTGCVENNGEAIVILAWFHKLYPPQNKPLLDAILENGCAISEHIFEPEKNARYEFLKRDQLMMSLSDLVVVVESKSKGGSKYTADEAMKKNIPVIKCKTETDDPELIEGHKTFLAKGAREAISPEHVIELISELKEKKEIRIKNNLDDFIES